MVLCKILEVGERGKKKVDYSCPNCQDVKRRLPEN